MQPRRYSYWRPLVAGIIAGGLGVGGAFYAASGAASGPLVTTAPSAASPASQEDDDAPPMIPRDPAGPVLEASPDSAGPVLEGLAPPVAEPTGPGAKPGAVPKPARRVIGEVTTISTEPALFTVRTPQGDEATFRVLDTTVFKAGYDRPYNFGLLKPGDGANVVARMMGPGQAAAGRPKPAGGPAPKRARPANGAAESDPELVAGQVVVRPAGDAAYRGAPKPGASKPGASKPGAAKPGAAKKGASDGVGQ